MEALQKLFDDTRRDRRYYHSTRLKVHQIEAAACAIREKAIVDCMMVLNLISYEQARKILKFDDK